MLEEVGAAPRARRIRTEVLIQSRWSESKTCQKMDPHHPPRQIPPRFLSQEHQKRGRSHLGELMRLEMPLPREYPKATVRDQVLERCQVTQNHLPKLSWGRDHRIKISPPPTGILRLAPETENQVGLGMDGHAEVLRSLRGDKIGLLHVYHNPKGATKREKGLDRLFGCLLRGGKNQLVVQIPEKSDPVRVSIR